ncbi:phophatidylserine decarboxylase associated domain-containing protein [Kitasatospora sp. NPDC059827]|uniref:phosphatidylserine decarboxylase family protein n=1 Tax=Kitasatospora sp. NPDC059827 TaxID=3346964 RepID=UPI003667D2BD
MSLLGGPDDLNHRHNELRRGGYLPQDLSAGHRWRKELAGRAGLIKGKLSPAVSGLRDLISRDGIVRMYVSEMIDQVPDPYKEVTDTEALLQCLNLIVSSAPEYNQDPAKRVLFPMATLFGQMLITPAGESAFRNREFNEAVRRIQREWCLFLDSPESCSVLHEGDNGWLSAPARRELNLHQYHVIPNALHWGFGSYNEFFHRRIRPEFRPITAPVNTRVITSANDGRVFKYERNVSRSADFWLKGQPYSLGDMLHGPECGDEHVSRFIGGDVFQSHLSGGDYHRWHSPVDGIVRHAEVAPGLLFSHSESANENPYTGTHSQAYQASINTRGLVFIEATPKNKMVCVMPIGMGDISSVTISVTPGCEVKKGDEIGYFGYGGSSLCLIFEPGLISHFTVPQNNPIEQPDGGAPITVNSQIAWTQ